MANYRLNAFNGLIVAAIAAFAITACKKEKTAPAVVEEIPLQTGPENTDTSAYMPEEPALSQVGGTSNRANPAAGVPGGIVSDGRYVVQVSVFKSSRMAGRLVEKLAAQGYPAYVAEVEDPAPGLSGTYHRVRVGTFRTLSDARGFGENTLSPLGFEFWVDKKSMDNVGMRDGGSSDYSSPSSSSAPAEPYSPAPREPSEPAYTPAPPTESGESSYSSPSSSSSSSPSSPSLPEPSAPSQPAADPWATPETTSPSEPSTVSPTPEPPAPGTSSGWGDPVDAGAGSSPADTGTPKLDDW